MYFSKIMGPYLLTAAVLWRDWRRQNSFQYWHPHLLVFLCLRSHVKVTVRRLESETETRILHTRRDALT